MTERNSVKSLLNETIVEIKRYNRQLYFYGKDGLLFLVNDDCLYDDKGNWFQTNVEFLDEDPIE